MKKVFFKTFRNLIFFKEDEELINMTIQELNQYDGIKNKKVYLACKNQIFDVTNSCKIYFLFEFRK